MRFHVFCVLLSSGQKEEVCFSETSVHCGKAEDHDINHHRCKTSCLVGLYFCPKTALHMKVVTRFINGSVWSVGTKVAATWPVLED